ncbi:MAG: lipid II flippase MurJ, partial [Planctomycetota bacterium]
MGMLNAQKHFFVPALAPAIFNVISVLAGIYLCFLSHPDAQLAFIWCIFTVVSTFAQLFCQVPTAWKTGWRPQIKLAGLFSNTDLRKMVGLMLPAVLGVAIVNINVFVNTRFASNIQGGLAHLNYAFRIFYLPIGMFGVALGTVAATIVAELLSEKKYEALQNYLSHTLKLNCLLTLPCTLGLIVLSFPTVEILFERGQFTAQDTRQTSLALCAYLVGLVPFTSTKILVPVFFALESSKLSLIASCTAVLSNFLFNYWTHKWLGSIGIAFGISLATFVQIGLLNYFLAKKIGALNWRDLGIFFGKTFLATLGMAVVTLIVFWGGIRLISVIGISGGRTFWVAFWLFSSILASVMSYFFLCQKLNLTEVKEILDVFQKIRKKLIRPK